MSDFHNQRAAEIINKILYITIASVSDEGQPWNSPVYSGFDDELNFYWSSAKNSQHSQNIRANGKIFIVIYDSKAKEGKGEGVYIQAEAAELDEDEAIIAARRVTQARKGQLNEITNDEPKKFKGSSVRRVYRATPQKIWMNDDELDENGKRIRDTRVEVILDALKNKILAIASDDTPDVKKVISKKEHLVNVHSRLAGEVKIIGEYLYGYNKQQMGETAKPIGFFSMIRIIMPIIETVADAQKVKPYDLLGELKVRTPNVMWRLYRHALLHGDEFVNAATTQGLGIPSGIALVNPNTDPEMTEYFAKDGRIANPFLLLNELIKYLDNVILDTDPKEKVKILETMVFRDNTPEAAEIRAIVTDIDKKNKLDEPYRAARDMEN